MNKRNMDRLAKVQPHMKAPLTKREFAVLHNKELPPEKEIGKSVVCYICKTGGGSLTRMQNQYSHESCRIAQARKKEEQKALY